LFVLSEIVHIVGKINAMQDKNAGFFNTIFVRSYIISKT